VWRGLAVEIERSINLQRCGGSENERRRSNSGGLVQGGNRLRKEPPNLEAPLSGRAARNQGGEGKIGKAVAEGIKKRSTLTGSTAQEVEVR